MARLSILLLLAALFYLYTSEGCKIGERYHGVSKPRNHRYPSRQPQTPSSSNQQPPQPQNSKRRNHRSRSALRKKDYDKLALVYHWGPSYCKKPQVKCTIPKTAKKTWTIHGLWPLGPTYCRGKYYNFRKLSSIEKEMIEKWPTYNRDGTNERFWKCEYEKHGTCAADIRQLDSQEKYFKGTMDLYDEYDITAILAKGNPAVTPSDRDTYPLPDITSALKKGLGVDPAVYCVEKKTGLYLWEVRMCFDKTLSPITCGDDLVGGGRCNPNKNVTYEPFDSYMTVKSLPAFDDLDALRFLLDVAEMGERERMRDEAEEGEKEDLWENSFGDDDDFCEEDD